MEIHVRNFESEHIPFFGFSEKILEDLDITYDVILDNMETVKINNYHVVLHTYSP